MTTAWKPDFTQSDPYAGMPAEYAELVQRTYVPTEENPYSPLVTTPSPTLSSMNIPAQINMLSTSPVQLSTTTVSTSTVPWKPDFTKPNPYEGMPPDYPGQVAESFVPTYENPTPPEIPGIVWTRPTSGQMETLKAQSDLRKAGLADYNGVYVASAIQAGKESLVRRAGYSEEQISEAKKKIATLGFTSVIPTEFGKGGLKQTVPTLPSMSLADNKLSMRPYTPKLSLGQRIRNWFSGASQKQKSIAAQAAFMEAGSISKITPEIAKKSEALYAPPRTLSAVSYIPVVGTTTMAAHQWPYLDTSAKQGVFGKIGAEIVMGSGMAAGGMHPSVAASRAPMPKVSSVTRSTPARVPLTEAGYIETGIKSSPGGKLAFRMPYEQEIGSRLGIGSGIEYSGTVKYASGITYTQKPGSMLPQDIMFESSKPSISNFVPKTKQVLVNPKIATVWRQSYTGYGGPSFLTPETVQVIQTPSHMTLPSYSISTFRPSFGQTVAWNAPKVALAGTAIGVGSLGVVSQQSAQVSQPVISQIQRQQMDERIASYIPVTKSSYVKIQQPVDVQTRIDTRVETVKPIVQESTGVTSTIADVTKTTTTERPSTTEDTTIITDIPSKVDVTKPTFVEITKPKTDEKFDDRVVTQTRIPTGFDNIYIPRRRIGIAAGLPLPKGGRSGGGGGGGAAWETRKLYQQKLQRIPRTVVYMPDTLDTSVLVPSMFKKKKKKGLITGEFEQTLAGRRRVTTVAQSETLKAGATEKSYTNTYRGRRALPHDIGIKV